MDQHDTTLIDSFLPEYDVEETHRITIRAAPAEVYRELLRLDLSQVSLFRWLFALRALPARLRGRHAPEAFDFDGLKQLGFVELARVADREITLGIMGKFWSLVPRFESFAADEFREKRAVGAAKAAWTFQCVAAAGGATQLTTQTRVKLGSSRVAVALFRGYWLFVRPLSGLIRMALLRHVRARVESTSLPRGAA